MSFIKNASVIVATYNQSKTVPLVIEALRHQTNRDFEVIIADDGSTSQELEVYRDSLKFLPVKSEIISQPDKGYRLAKSRNNAIHLAKNDLLIFLDGDVVPDKNMVESHINTHSRTCQNSIAYTDREHIDLLNWNARIKTEANMKLEAFEADLRNSMYIWQRCWGFNVSYPNKPEVLFDEAFEGWGLEDTELAYRLVKQNGYKVVKNSETTSYHINLPHERARNPYDHNTNENLRAFARNVLHFVNKHATLEVMRATIPTVPVKPVGPEVFLSAFKESLTLHELKKQKETLKQLIL